MTDLLRTNTRKPFGSVARIICLVNRATNNNSIHEFYNLANISPLCSDTGREDLPVADNATQEFYPFRTGSRGNDAICPTFNCKMCNLFGCSLVEELGCARWLISATTKHEPP